MLSALPCLLISGALAAAPGPADLGPGHTLEPRATFTDTLGQTHTRYVHRYRGLRVWGSEYLTHSAGGKVVADTHALAVSAPDLPPLPSPILDQARQRLSAALTARGTFGTIKAQAEPLAYPLFVDLAEAVTPGATLNADQLQHVLVGYATAYLMEVDPGTPDDPVDDWEFIVDAGSGAILAEFQLSKQDAPAKGTGNTLYSGQVTLDTTATDTGFVLVDRTRGASGAYGGNAVIIEGTAETGLGPFFNPTNLWGNGQIAPAGADPSSVTGTTPAADAAYGVQAAWDYFRQVHGRNGFDGNGTGVTLKFNPNDVDNASWLGESRLISVGEPKNFLQIVHPAILGHELTHGVTETTANLIFGGESGGLNEGMSDAFGAMVAFFVYGDRASPTPWVLNRYIQDSEGRPQPVLFRSMIKPSLDGRSRDAWAPDLKDLDPHFSSGPLNRAFYFLCEGASADSSKLDYSPFLPNGMAGIGRDKAARIWYRALTTYLTYLSGYLDARVAALRAAVDLFGVGSAENVAVRQAFAAINVGRANLTPDVFSSSDITTSATWSGSNLVLTATPSRPDVTQVDFLVDQVPVGSAHQPDFALTVDALRTLANGTHTVVATAYAAGEPLGVSEPVTFQQDLPAQQLLRDPGLEGVPSLSWRGDLEQLIQADPGGTRARGGSHFALFSRARGLQHQTLAQRVTLPAGSAYARLDVWVLTSSQTLTTALDFLRLQVASVSAPGQASTLLASYDLCSNLDAWPFYGRKSVDLAAFAGQTVELRLVSDVNPGTGTTFWVDDLTLVAGSAAPVAVQITPDRQYGYAGVPMTLNAQVTGAADPSVTWSLPGGAGSSGGTLAPGGTPGSVIFTPQPGDFRFTDVRVKATSTADPGAMAEAIIQTLSKVAVLPTGAQILPGGTLVFKLLLGPGVGPVTVTLAGPGTLDRQGDTLVFTAGPAPGSTYIDAEEQGGAGNFGSAKIQVVAPAPVSVQPRAFQLAAGASTQFTALAQGNPAALVLWAVAEGEAGGHMTPTGLYTAPAVPGIYHVVATNAADPTQSGSATVIVVPGMALDPPSPVLLTGGTTRFRASLPPTLAPGVTWSVVAANDGTITTDGVYTAPAMPGTYTVKATSQADPTQSATAQVRVKTTDLNGDGKVLMDPADLALLADAWGSAVPDGTAPADLNGDGVVNDEDVVLFFSRFGGLP